MTEPIVQLPEEVRKAFEAWISAPPYERDIHIWPDHAPVWPGCYRDYETHLAWDAWQAAYRCAAREYALAGVRVAKEAAAAMVMDWDDTRRGLNASDTAASILDIPEQPILDSLTEAGKEG